MVILKNIEFKGLMPVTSRRWLLPTRSKRHQAWRPLDKSGLSLVRLVKVHLGLVELVCDKFIRINEGLVSLS